MSRAKQGQSKSARRAWWASLSPEQQAGYIESRAARRSANPSRTSREASARLDIATERGIFMAEVPDEDVAERLRAA